MCPAVGAEELDRIAGELSSRGVAVLPRMLPSFVAAELGGRLDAVYRRQCDELGEALLIELDDADVVRCPLAYDDAFIELAHHPAIRRAATHLLGENIVLLMQNGVINRPDRPHAQMRLHRDLNHQNWVSSAPLALSALVCLDDFTEETGATVVLPGSHRSAAIPPADIVRRSAIPIVAPAGSVIFMDAMTFHRTGANSSTGPRRAVNHVIGVPILAQAIDIPAALARKPPGDPWSAAYLGYRWNPARDPRDWRLRKLQQARPDDKPDRTP